jgi:ABC-type transporter Mla subunit MlaD
MVTQAPKRSAVAVAVAFCLSCVGLIIFVWTQFGGTIPFAPTGYQISALFKETGLLVPGADVRISGITVGKVDSVANRGVDSFVTMDLDPPYAPLPDDTRAIVRQKTLLGEAYVALSTGTRTAPKFPDGATIPDAQVAQTQSLDEVLSTFNPQNQRRFEALLDGTASALAGRGEDLNFGFGNLDPVVTDLGAIVTALDAQQGNLRRVIQGGATITTTLGRRSADVQSLVRAGEQVLSATAARDGALTATVNGLPPFLARLDTTLRIVNGTLSAAQPSLRAIEPAAPLVVPALSDLIKLSGPAVALLHEAPSLLDAADRALPAITRFNRAFKPAVDVLLPAAREIVPVIAFMGLYSKELTTAMANLSATLEGTAPADTPSGRASYLRAVPMIGDETIFGQSVREPSNRNDTYFAPGELADVGTGGLQAANCSNVHDPSELPLPGGNVPCRVQPPVNWGLGLSSGYFPRLTKAPLPR